MSRKPGDEENEKMPYVEGWTQEIDSKFEARVDELLKSGDESLLRGISPDLSRKLGFISARSDRASRSARSAGRARFGRLAFAAAGALAASILFAVTWIQKPALSLEPRFSGQIEAARGAADSGKRDRAYGVESILQVDFTVPADASRADHILRVFEVDSRNRLRPLELSIRQEVGEDGLVTHSARGAIAALFAPPVIGAHRLAFVLAPHSSDLGSLAGTELEAAKKRSDLRLMTDEIFVVASPR